MKIYHNARLVAALKRFIPHRNGDWLNRLIGINLEEDQQGDINVYPVYRSLQVRRFKEGVLIQTPLFNMQLLILIDRSGIHCKFLEASELSHSDVGITEQKQENN